MLDLADTHEPAGQEAGARRAPGAAAAEACGFRGLLHRLLTREQVAGVADVARGLGLSYASFYARLRGRASFRPEELRRVLALVPDRRLADHLLADSPFIAVPRTDVPATAAPGEPMSDALSALEQVTTLMRELDAAERAGRLGRARRERIERSVHEAERSLATLRRRLSRELVVRATAGARRGGGD